jgi:hypothetical protein
MDALAGHAGLDRAELEAAVSRLSSSGCVDAIEENGVALYRSSTLVIPLGAPVGWEAAVFDHFKALVNTITTRLAEDRTSASLADRVGGSTYSLDVWEGHPLAEDVYGTLARVRSLLSEQRAKVEEYNAEHGIPENYTRVVHYAGQCLISEGITHDEPA